jgi:hypothetical protein
MLAAIVDADATARAHHLPADGLPELDRPGVLATADHARQGRPVTLPVEPSKE